MGHVACYGRVTQAFKWTWTCDDVRHTSPVFCLPHVLLVFRIAARTRGNTVCVHTAKRDWRFYPRASEHQPQVASLGQDTLPKNTRPGPGTKVDRRISPPATRPTGFSCIYCAAGP